MTDKQKQQYRQTDELRELFKNLANEKFRLDCGHHVTFNQWLVNSVTIKNGKELIFICAECGY
ncbi:MAG: hypothetical protein L3J79_10900 [Candidatus Marinimicrobia bacterium]|nr:hypothetical protein [Candidatus Neomarinimicrobiota bacterium]